MGVEGSTMGAGPSAAEARFTELYARYESPVRAFCNRRAPSAEASVTSAPTTSN
jgi:hypothetical protein